MDNLPLAHMTLKAEPSPTKSSFMSNKEELIVLRDKSRNERLPFVSAGLLYVADERTRINSVDEWIRASSSKVGRQRASVLSSRVSRLRSPPARASITQPLNGDFKVDNEVYQLDPQNYTLSDRSTFKPPINKDETQGDFERQILSSSNTEEAFGNREISVNEERSREEYEDVKSTNSTESSYSNTTVSALAGSGESEFKQRLSWTLKSVLVNHLVCSDLSIFSMTEYEERFRAHPKPSDCRSKTYMGTKDAQFDPSPASSVPTRSTSDSHHNVDGINAERSQYGSKRKRCNNLEHDGDERKEECDGKKRKIGNSRLFNRVSPARRFACPYFKRNTQHHRLPRSCKGPGWPTVHRVKEHVYRNHSRAPQCQRCQRIFDDGGSLKQHLRQAIPCEKVDEVDEVDGFDDEQGKLLRSRKKRNHSSISETEEWVKSHQHLYPDDNDSRLIEVRRWREMYRILFPKDTYADIPSPYYDDSTTDGEIQRFENVFHEQIDSLIHEEVDAFVHRTWPPILPPEERLESFRNELGSILKRVHTRILAKYRESRQKDSVEITREEDMNFENQDNGESSLLLVQPFTSTGNEVDSLHDGSSFHYDFDSDLLSAEVLQEYFENWVFSTDFSSTNEIIQSA